MLAELCQELHNWFEVEKFFGEFEIVDGSLIVDGLQQGQYFRIIGSVFNDGVYQYPATDLTDEVFDGAVWAMAIPSEVVALAAAIDEWRAKNETADSAAMSPFQSESFGGYSYTKGSGGNSSGGGSGVGWQEVFCNKLNRWRKMKI